MPAPVMLFGTQSIPAMVVGGVMVNCVDALDVASAAVIVAVAVDPLVPADAVNSAVCTPCGT